MILTASFFCLLGVYLFITAHKLGQNVSTISWYENGELRVRHLSLKEAEESQKEMDSLMGIIGNDPGVRDYAASANSSLKKRKFKRAVLFPASVVCILASVSLFIVGIRTQKERIKENGDSST